MTNLYSPTEMMNVVHSLIASQDLQDGIKQDRTNAKASMLEQLQAAENEAITLPIVKAEVYDAEGWTYKVYDADLDKMVTIEGEKAPATVSTAFSEAKRAKVKGFAFADFATWEDMKKACKEDDDQAGAKETFREIVKTAKKLDKGWNDYIEGALDKLLAEVQKAQATK
jgi:hypothetical protein